MIAATQSNHPLGPITLQQKPLDDARTRIRDGRMRITKPRMAIIETLLRHQGPVSIERIHQGMGPKVCDLVTVYRCLSAFEKIGMVRRSYQHNGTCLYELVLGRPNHYHIVCKSCGRPDRVDYFPVEGMERMLQERGYTQITHIVEFFGVCPACQTSMPAVQRQTTVPASATRDLTIGAESSVL